LSLPTELETLFGKHINRQAKRLAPGQVDALAVNEAAGALLRLRGQPGRQIELVRNMQPGTAAALCRWLGDPAFWGLVGGITRQ